jgi:tetratricopeptide (TPR) repeat protein
MFMPGDIIGQQFEVVDRLGAGGFGVVYLVDFLETGHRFALKTFRDDFLWDDNIRDKFRIEAQIWIDLGYHSNLVRAYFIDEVSGRLYITMEYIAPRENRMNTLEDFLVCKPPGLDQALKWMIHCCRGLDYAYSRGVESHRDIKPANIMIKDGRDAKVTDFGLAKVLDLSRLKDKHDEGAGKQRFSGHTMLGKTFGTPTHMPPEQYEDAATCDQRSDIYSLGVVLFQLVTGGSYPFMTQEPRDGSKEEQRRFWREMHHLHATAPVPRIDSPAAPIIERCLEKDPDRRYRDVSELQEQLEEMLRKLYGECVERHEGEIRNRDYYQDKGSSLLVLGDFVEALSCFEKVIELAPDNAGSWHNKSAALHELGRYEESISCSDRALELDRSHYMLWYGKANSLIKLSRFEEALECYRRSVDLRPSYARAWGAMASCLDGLGRRDEALECYDRSLSLDDSNVAVLSNRSALLGRMGRHEDAMKGYEEAINLDPKASIAWHNRGKLLKDLGRLDDSMASYDRAVEIDPHYADAWNGKGIILCMKNRFEEAIGYYDTALRIKPDDEMFLTNKGRALSSLGRYDEALSCFEKAINCAPDYMDALYYKGNTLFDSGRYLEAIECYNIILDMDPHDASAMNGKGNCFINLGLLDEALVSYEACLDAHPDYVYSLLGKGNCLNEMGKPEKAIECYTRITLIDENYEMAWYNKGIVEMRTERKIDAVESLRKFLAVASPLDREKMKNAEIWLRELEN